MKPIRLGHIGTLHDHSSAKLACVKKFPELFEVIGCVAESREREEELKNLPPYAGTPFMTREELSELKPEAVLVEGFELNLIDDAMFWVSKGVHVHIDKPAGDSPEKLESLYRMAERTGAQIQFAYMYRYNAAFLDCMVRIERGELGEIYEVDAVMDTCHDEKKREWLSAFPGGIMFFLGCHMIDLVYRIQGLPEKIHPFLKSTGFDGVRSIDHGFAAFEYPKGISTVRATSTEVNGYGRRQLVVCGSKGTYEIEPLEAPTHAYFIPKSASRTFADCRQEVSLPVFDPLCRYDGMMRDFYAFVRGEKKNMYDKAYETALEKILLYCCGKQDIDWRN